MQILEDYKTVTDKDGLVQPPEGRSNNGVRYTGEMVIALVKHGALSQEESTRLRAVLSSCEREPGLLMRSPRNTGGYQSVDDTIAAITIDHFVGTGFTKRFLEYGRTQGATFVDKSIKKYPKEGELVFALFTFLGAVPVKYVYNNIVPRGFTLSSWLGRQQQLICHAQFVAGENPPMYRKLWWAIAVLSSMRSKYKDWDAKILALHLVKAAKGKSPFCDAIRNIWIRWFKQFPRGAAEFVWKNHPSSKWLEGEFGE